MRDIRDIPSAMDAARAAAYRTAIPAAVEEVRLTATSVDGAVEMIHGGTGPGDEPAGPIFPEEVAQNIEDEALLARFSPKLILFPEAVVGSAPPYESRYDYHPRDVRIYLRQVRKTGRLVPIGAAGIAVTALAFYVATIVPAVALWLASPAAKPPSAEGWAAVVGLALLPMLVLGAVVVARAWRTTPRTSDEVKELLRDGDDGRRGQVDSLYMSIAPPIGIGTVIQWVQGPRQSVWADYCRYVAAENAVSAPPDLERYPKRVYGRVVRNEDHERTALQYWLFYLYNDWWNTHEGDWELVTVYLKNDAPKAVAYSSHLGGRWRTWDTAVVDRDMPGASAAIHVAEADNDVQSHEHPVVYIAKGSHANYFSEESRTYETALLQPWSVWFLRGRLTVSGHNDEVVARAGARRDEYQLERIPRGAETAVRGSALWDEWWWLQYRGLWGAKSGITGPAVQSERWDDPWVWAERMCVPDTTPWDATFR